MKTSNAYKMIARAGVALETDPRYHRGLIARFGYHNIELTDQDGEIIAIQVAPAHEQPDPVSDYSPGTYFPSLTRAINYVLERREESEPEEVDMIASGYEWTCPHCEHFNREIEVNPAVKCRGCGRSYNVNDYYHAIG